VGLDCLGLGLGAGVGNGTLGGGGMGAVTLGSDAIVCGGCAAGGVVAALC
jgi:hypothetical protein